MLVTTAWFAGSAVAVIVAGTVLSRAADCIAERTGLGRLTVGVLLLASATSLPEIITDVSAVRMGALDLAVGNLMGSCVMNLVILAVLDLVHYARHRASLLSRVVVGHARTATLGVVLLGIAAVSVLTKVTPAVGGVGVGTILIGAVYAAGLRSAITGNGTEASDGRPEPSTAADSMSLRAAVVTFVAGTMVIALAGPTLARSADQLAAATGLGETFFGSVVLAVVTVLPELTATVTAIRIGAHDLAVGNLFGSNAFNVVVLLLLDVVDGTGPLLALVETQHVLTALVAIIATALAMQITIAHQERRVWLVEPDALALIAALVAGLGVMYVAR